MSRLVTVQDVPAGIADVAEVPDDFEPAPLACGRAEVLTAAAALGADVSDPSWLRVEGGGLDLELTLEREDPLMSVGILDRSPDRAAADAWIAALLTRVGARAFDVESETGLFRAP